jgi:hypothetical protein
VQRDREVREIVRVSDKRDFERERESESSYCKRLTDKRNIMTVGRERERERERGRTESGRG